MAKTDEELALFTKRVEELQSELKDLSTEELARVSGRRPIVPAVELEEEEPEMISGGQMKHFPSRIIDA